MSHTVLHITDNPDYLKRPYLHNLLKQSMQKPVTTVVAGAGYGKTQAVYEFLQAYDAVTIWLQLSQFDNLPTRFWENFIYSSSLQNATLASDMKAIGVPMTMQEYDRFLHMLRLSMDPYKKHVFVLDDFHLINEPRVLNFVKFLIDARIPNVSIIIISRKQPDININELISKRVISIINEDNLRFSKEEMIRYFQMQKIYISTKSISDVCSYTEGWIFAIRLVALSFKKGTMTEDYAISAAKRDLFRLIENEVFSAITQELQDFLVKLSLIDNLPLELLMTLSDNNLALISEIAEISSFIRYDAFLKTYRMHHLFLSFLYEKQAALKKDDKRAIYNESADWYAKNGYTIDALSYYEKAEQYDKLLKTISTLYAACSEEMAIFISGILNRLPEHVYEEKPFAQVIRAKLILNSFKFEESYVETLKIIKKYESLPKTEEHDNIIGECYIILGIISFVQSAYTGRYDFQEFFKSADAYLPNGSALINKDNFSFNTGNYSCCIGLSAKGEFDKFINAICNTMPYASRVTHGSGFGTEYLCLTEKSYFQRDLKNAEKYAYQAIKEAKKQDQYPTVCLSLFYLVRINISFGNYPKILSLLDELRATREKDKKDKSYKILDMMEGWFYSLIKQPDKVADWIKIDIEKFDRTTTPIDYILGRLVKARYYLAEQKYDELLTFLDQCDELYGLGVFVLGVLEKQVLKAVALYQQKETALAMTVLQEAYDIAAPNDLYMPFVEQGSKMRTLVNAAINNKNCTIPKQWLEMISTKSSAYAKSVSKVIIEYRMANHLENDIRSDFTPKELELLTCLCHGLSRDEMASELGLSVNTVKSTLQIIFDKLGAVNAVDAVRIAISFGLTT